MFLEHLVIATGIAGGCVNGTCAVATVPANPVTIVQPAVVVATPQQSQMTVEYRRNIFGRLKPVKARTKTEYQALMAAPACANGNCVK